MPYEHLTKVGLEYGDQSFPDQSPGDNPRVLILGTGSGGLSHELFFVNQVRAAEQEFGADSELLQGVHESDAQGATNIACMRIGGRKGQFVFTDSAGGTLTITPEYRDNEILDRYALAMEVNSGTQRIAVYDLVDDQWVYDSDEILVINQGVIDVDTSSLDTFTTGDFDNPDTMTALSGLSTSDFTDTGTATADTVSATQGADGESMTLVERYAALNTGYHLLDFRDADMVDPRGVYLDYPNVADGDSLNLWAGPPLDGEDDALGYVWQYIYRGKLYTYFVDSDSFFADLDTAAVATVTEETVTLEAKKKGAGANGQFSLEITGGGTAGSETATVTETAGKIAVVVDVDPATSTSTQAATAINNALADTTLSNGVTADLILEASGDGSTIAAIAGPTDSASGAGGNYATHEELTGDTVPGDVHSEFLADADTATREVNFGHQLATFLWLASTNWKTMIGTISYQAPTDVSREGVSSWAGDLPTYTTKGSDLVIDAPDDNGSGLLGNKFLAGRASSTDGYRNEQIETGDVGDGYAYGGFILTEGNQLPNGSDWPYGIDSGDERTGPNGAPVDIGKHLLVTYDWPVHSNSFNGGTPYRGPLTASLLGKLTTIPEHEQPIGTNGFVSSLSSPPRMHSTQQDALASIRAIGLKLVEGRGYRFITTKTAAHPDSDYTRVSTIRSANRLLQGIRDIAADYVGRAFNSRQLIALRTAIEQFLVTERGDQIHQGAVFEFNYTREDRILGRLTINLRFVPPFSIEAITVSTTLAADESELQ